MSKIHQRNIYNNYYVFMFIAPCWKLHLEIPAKLKPGYPSTTFQLCCLGANFQKSTTLFMNYKQTSKFYPIILTIAINIFDNTNIKVIPNKLRFFLLGQRNV